MTYRGRRHLKSRGLSRLALVFLFIILSIFFFITKPVASNIVRTNSSLLNIDWGMSPEQVLYATKEYSRDAELIEYGENAVLTQRERITDSDIAAKSEVIYSFKNGQLYNIKITKTIKYWPDFILEQLLYKTVANYEIDNAFKSLTQGKIYQAENTDERKVIYLGYDDFRNPIHAFVEMSSKL